MSFTIRTTNVTLHNYRELEADPSEDDFNEWIKILPEEMANKFRNEGYRASNGVISLRRHTVERNDIGLSEYMRRWLPSEDYSRWIERGKTANPT